MTLKTIQMQLEPHGQGTFHWTRLLRALYSLSHEQLQGWGIHIFYGNLIQCLTTLTAKNFLTSSLNLSFAVWSHSPLSCHYIPMCKVLLLPSCGPLLATGRCYKVSPMPSVLPTEQSQLFQPVFTAEVLRACDQLSGLLWTCSNRSASFLCWGP